MKLLVIGSGGREHALVWKLAQSPHVTKIWAAPGNPGMELERLHSNGLPVELVKLGAEELQSLLAFARENRPDLVVVGPDNPLALGIVDLFRISGFRIWGPERKAAQFESSKAFSQDFMSRRGIPTARAGTFSDPAEALRFAETLAGCCAIKADGLALGKGVLLSQNMEEARSAIEEIMVQRTFGTAGSRVVIQEFLRGTEISLHALCDGNTVKLFPTSQDHKRALDGDKGLNTGGMGTFSPAPFLSPAGLDSVGRAILDPWLAGCRAEGIFFQGILYPGVMLTDEGPKVIEFNARFGDPETQVYMPRLENDLVELLDASVDGTLDRVQLRWSTDFCVCVVMASGGYPGSYTKGRVIRGLEEAERLPGVKVFHAGTARKDNQWLTQGGRVLGVTAWRPTLADARRAAYAAVELIQFENAHFRRDIAMKGLTTA